MIFHDPLAPIESKLKNDKINLDFAENIEKETGLTAVVESSGEAPVVENIVKEDQKNVNPGMGSGITIIVVTIIAAQSGIW